MLEASTSAEILPEYDPGRFHHCDKMGPFEQELVGPPWSVQIISRRLLLRVVIPIQCKGRVPLPRAFYGDPLRKILD